MKTGHNFSKEDGYTGSAGMIPVKGHFRSGGSAKENDHVDSPVPTARLKPSKQKEK